MLLFFINLGDINHWSPSQIYRDSKEKALDTRKGEMGKREKYT